jgi:hypothetical protein
MKFYTVDKFIETLKKGNLNEIVASMTSVVYDNKNVIINKTTKINLIADNICSLKLETIAQLLPLYGIKYKAGSRTNLYIRSVDCSEQIFGFITSYYSVDKQTRIYAYERALQKNKINIMKKIRDLDPYYLKKLRDYTERTPSINEATKSFVASDYKKTSSKKDTSPEDFLKKKLKHSVNKMIKEFKKTTLKTTRT